MEYQQHPTRSDLAPGEGMGLPFHPCACCNEDVTEPSDNGSSCGCGHQGGWGLNGYPLAMVYAPGQMFRGLYDPDTALAHGTLFSELNLPLEVGYAHGGGCGCGRCNERRGMTC